MSVRILTGDCRATLQTLPDASVHCVVTSPPFWQLRDYGVDGQIGLEKTPALWVAALVGVFRAVRRVLRPDGVAWVEVGDVYANSGRGGNPGASPHTKQRSNAGSLTMRSRRTRADGIKAKDLVGAPWMLAFALRDDGWWLRSECLWHKPTAMPESVTDRPSRSHSTVFLLTKSARYFYDADAVRTPLADKTRTTYSSKRRARTDDHTGLVASIRMDRTMPDRKPRLGDDGEPAGANLRSVWSIASKPYAGAHFATFPPELAETCIRAGTSERGCCSACGAPWKQVTEKRRAPDRPGRRQSRDGDSLDNAHGRDGRSGNRYSSVIETLGWSPGCDCGAGVVPCTVLDPFGGTGTTAAVATTLGRDAVTCELNPDYVEMARDRLGLFAPPRDAATARIA